MTRHTFQFPITLCLHQETACCRRQLCSCFESVQRDCNSFRVPAGLIPVGHFLQGAALV